VAKKELAERLMTELGVGADELPACVVWARGLVSANNAPVERGLSRSGELRMNASVDGAQWVLVPLDAIASFGPESSAVVELREPFNGRLHWVPVPLSAVTHFGLEPPCWEDGCNGQDPEVSGCSNGSVTIDGRDIRDPHSGVVVGTVELRYSRACQTNWVRMTRLCRNERRLEAYLRDESGNMIAVTSLEVEPPHVYGYGAMWYAPTGKVRVQACGLIDGCDEVCTSLH
jgi:hypothetical protein